MRWMLIPLLQRISYMSYTQFCIRVCTSENSTYSAGEWESAGRGGRGGSYVTYCHPDRTPIHSQPSNASTLLTRWWVLLSSSLVESPTPKIDSNINPRRFPFLPGKPSSRVANGESISTRLKFPTTPYPWSKPNIPHPTLTTGSCQETTARPVSHHVMPILLSHLVFTHRQTVPLRLLLRGTLVSTPSLFIVSSYGECS
jgi:hypothetical protein